MTIRLDTFGGIIPRLASDKLPAEGAQIAHNVDLRSGALAKLTARATTEETRPPWDDVIFRPLSGTAEDETSATGANEKQVPDDQIVYIPPPEPPTVTEMKYFLPVDLMGSLVALEVYWFPEFRGADGTYQCVRQSMNTTHKNTRMSDSGVKLTYQVWGNGQSWDVGMDNGNVYVRITGPKYRFVFSPTNSDGWIQVGETGGVPHDYAGLPFNPITELTAPELPIGHVPLYFEERVYAHLQPVDVRGPKFDEQYYVTEPMRRDFENFEVEFTFNLNYTQPRRRYFYYRSANTRGEMEGPPSDVSEMVSVAPGQYPVLDTKLSGEGKLYRSASGHDGFQLLADSPGEEYNDYDLTARREALPPYGNAPVPVTGEDNPLFLEDDVSVFTANSRMHPAGFGVAISGNDVRCSDLYRLHVWPEEYSHPFEAPPIALELVGNTILVFTATQVFALTGGNPERLNKYLLSNEHPLLNSSGLCRIGNTAFWPTSYGLAASTGGAVQLVTRNHFTEAQWTAYAPESMQAFAGENCIYLTREGGAGLRIELGSDDALRAVTTFGDTLPAAGLENTEDGLWRSRTWRFDEPTMIEAIRVVATSNTVVTLDAGTATETVAVDNENITLLTTMAYSREVTVTVQTPGTVSAIELFPRQIHQVNGPITLLGAQVPQLQRNWFQFPDRGNFVAASVRAHAAANAVKLSFHDAAGEVIEYAAHAVDNGEDTITPTEAKGIEAAPNGNRFDLPRMPKHTVVCVQCTSTNASGAASSVVLDELTLIPRQAQAVGDSLREVNDSTGLPPWLLKRYDFRDEISPKVAVVHSVGDTALSMRCYTNGDDSFTTFPITGHETDISALGSVASLEFDFSGNDHLVHEVLIVGADVRVMGSGPLRICDPLSWTGLRIKFPDRGTLAVASVDADDYDDVNLALLADGTQVYSGVITSGNMVQLPYTMGEAAQWTLSITGASHVNCITLWPRVRVPVGDDVRLIARDTDIPPWCWQRYEWPEQSAPRSGRVFADGFSDESVGLQLFLDDADALSGSRTVENSREFAFTHPSLNEAAGSFMFDFNGQDYRVNEVVLWRDRIIPATTEPLQLPARMGLRNLTIQFPKEHCFALVKAQAHFPESASSPKESVKVELKPLAGVQGDTRFATITADTKASLGRFEYLEPSKWASTWTLDVTSDVEVDSITLIPWRLQQSGPLLEVSTTYGGIEPWRYTDFEMPEHWQVASLAIEADEYPTLASKALWLEVGPVETFKTDSRKWRMLGGNEWRLDTPMSIRRLRMRAWCGDTSSNRVWHNVAKKITLFPLQIVPVADAPVTVTGYTGHKGWLNKLFQFVEPGRFAVIQVAARDYDNPDVDPEQVGLLVSLTSKEGKAVAATAKDSSAVDLPVAEAFSSEWTLDLDIGTRIVDAVTLYPRILRQAGDVLDLMAPSNAVEPWRYTDFEMPPNHEIASVRVEHGNIEGAALTLTAWDGPWFDSRTVNTPQDAEYPIAPLQAQGLRVACADARRITVYPVETIPVSNGGLHIRRDASRFPWRNKRLQFPEQGSFAVLRVVADQYPVIVRLNGFEFVIEDAHEVRLENAQVGLPVATDEPDPTGLTHLTQCTWANGDVTYVPATAPMATTTEPETGRAILPNTKEWALDVVLPSHTQVPAAHKDAPPTFVKARHSVRELLLMGRRRHTVRDGLVVVRRDQEPFTWLAHEIMALKPLSWTCARVVADQYPVTLRLFADGKQVMSRTVQSDTSFKLPRFRPERHWELDVLAEPGNQVHEAALATSMGRLRSG